MRNADRLGIRWTIGDVSPEGFEALRLSLWGAWRLFGPDAAYAVCVNSVPLAEARERTGSVPGAVRWHEVTRDMVPDFLRSHTDEEMAEGVAWKFARIRLFRDRFELSLDNDCILWDAPEAIRLWLERGEGFVTAEDTDAHFGQFAELGPPEPRNSGIRGLPPGFDFEAALREFVASRSVVMTSETDEQGLQIALLWRHGARVVRTDEVSICSPFPAHLQGLGRCGAHFVGLNARSLPWEYDGRPASELVREHWRRHRGSIEARIGPE